MTDITTTNPDTSAGVVSSKTTVVQDQSIIKLHDGYSVTKIFYDLIMQQVVAMLPRLTRNKSYTAKKLCGKEFWGLLEKGECLIAGRSIAHMVVHGVLPLRFVKWKHEYPLHYELM